MVFLVFLNLYILTVHSFEVTLPVKISSLIEESAGASFRNWEEVGNQVPEYLRQTFRSNMVNQALDGLLELSKSGIYGELSDKGSTAKFKLLGRLYGYSILYEITPLIPLSPPYLRMLRGSKTILQSDIHNVDRVQSIEGFKNHEWFGKVLYESYDSRSFKAFSEGFFKMVSKRGSFLSLGSVSRMDWRMLVDREVTVDVLENSAVYIGLGRDDVIVRWFWDWARSLRRLTILRKLLYYPAIPVGGIENARDWQGRTVGLKVMQSENSCANFITESNSVELPGTYTDFDDFSRALDMALKGEKIVLGRAGKISKCV